MRSRVESALSVLVGLAAVAIAVSVVARPFFPAAAARAAAASTQPDYLASWREALPIGIRVGDTTAPVTIVELADLECPACRGFQPTLRSVMEAHPHEVSLVYVSYPLRMHRFAMGAARAAECASKRGKFPEWVDAVYAKQDSLGLKSWGAYAEEAGIADTAAISKCARSPAPVERIVAGMAFGNKIHLIGTPTVIVNGWRFPYTPNEDELTSVVESLAKGEMPFDTTARSESS